ncbi:MAG: XRE family transcriptional regulator [Planctomycetes bacterium]|nr:XRE family transcriptional regulator [Planctomycetota bacterium]
MNRRRGARVPVAAGSGNVFADAALPDADELQMKAEFTRQLHNRIKALGLTQVQAGRRLGLKQPDVSRLMRGRFTGFSVDRLIALLNALQIDVEIILRPHEHDRGGRGNVRVVAAFA